MFFSDVHSIVKIAAKLHQVPSSEDQQEMTKGFKFPLTVGAIDGCHICSNIPNLKSLASSVLKLDRGFKILKH